MQMDLGSLFALGLFIAIEGLVPFSYTHLKEESQRSRLNTGTRTAC